MSYLDYQIALAHQTEIASRAQQAQKVRDLHDTVELPCRRLRVRVRQTVATLGVCLAAIGGFAVTDAHAKAAVRLSPAQMTRQISINEANGWLELQCTREGISMVNSHGTLKTIPY
jgi:hypothetical protein